MIPIILFGLYSCKKNKVEGKIINDPEFAEELRQSNDTLTIGDNTLVLKTDLWRDFFPPAEENGSPMVTINKITDIDSVTLQSTINLKKQYVLKEDEIWTADYSEVKENDFILEGIVRDGPKWGPNIEVDVVCEFENSGIIYRIISKSQLINATQ